MDRLIQTDGLREHSGSKKGRPTSQEEEKTKTCRGNREQANGGQTQRTGRRWTDTENRQAVDRHREQASGGQTQRTGKRWTDTQIAGHTDRKKKTEEQIDKNKQAMSQADRGRGNQLNNHSHN